MDKETLGLLECGHMESPHSSTTRGYGTYSDGKRYCYKCCADRDRADMIKTGRAILYLIDESDTAARHYAEVTNWSGSLRFRVNRRSTGRHNIAGVRYDVWFNGPNYSSWHGVQYGNNTQICYCRRTNG